jgi:hypothetical protein
MIENSNVPKEASHWITAAKARAWQVIGRFPTGTVLQTFFFRIGAT